MVLGLKAVPGSATEIMKALYHISGHKTSLGSAQGEASPAHKNS